MASDVRFTQPPRFSFPDSEKISPPVMAFHNVSFSYSGKKEAGCKPLLGTSGYCEHNDAMMQVPQGYSRCWPYALQINFTLESLVLIEEVNSGLSIQYQRHM